MDAPVIIVGAGPSGLVLAAELRLAGVEVFVLDKLEQRSGESRGLGFTARTLEMFDQRGLVPRFGDVEISPLGHFGGVPMDYSVLEGSHFGARGIPQHRIEAVLEDWATELGAEIMRGWEVVALTADDEGVEVEAVHGDARQRLRAGWLVACDGGRSTVRRLAGFDFPGSDATIEMYLADVAGCDLPARQIGEKMPGGMVMSAPLGDGVDRIIVCERGTPPKRRTEPPSFTEVAAAWQRLTGEDISHGEGRWVSAFGDATRQVTEYRRGRVLIAGDAAHVHLPAGGQGLSVSVQDVFNLGWKLAGQVLGWAPPDLLDSYHRERHPVGARLLMNTQAQGMLYLSGQDMEPLRGVFAELMRYDDVLRHLSGMVSGLAIRYDLGSEHPLVGMRLPKADLVSAEGKTTTIAPLEQGLGAFLDFSEDAGLAAVARRWPQRVNVVSAQPHCLSPASPLTGVPALLARPDGYVAWAGGDAADLAGAMERWFGPATA